MNTNEHKTNNNELLFKDERLARIRKVVDERGQVSVLDLSQLFGVSEATIRRDLEEMDGQWVRRTHGGAVRLGRAGKEPPMMVRVEEQSEEKVNIGQAAALSIQDGETVFLGSGTTVLEIARHLPQDITLTVITNSLPVVNELAARANISLVVIGGMLRPSELSMVGHIAEQAIREFRADKVFLGMRAVDVRQGFTNDYLPETMTDRTILTIAPEIIVVADHTKLGRVSSVLVAPVNAATRIITDRGISDDDRIALEEAGLEVVIV